MAKLQGILPPGTFVLERLVDALNLAFIADACAYSRCEPICLEIEELISRLGKLGATVAVVSAPASVEGSSVPLIPNASPL
jgi:hypothetical protein